MRSSQQIATTLRRSLHTTSLLPRAQPSPAQRHFHLTAPAQMPRRRNFFTSNAVLQQQQQQGKDDSAAATADAEHASPAAAARRKPRAAGTKGSLRRVAALAQQPGGKQEGATATTATRTPQQQPAAPQAEQLIRAVCAAESYDMAQVQAILAGAGFALDPDGTGFESHEVVHARRRPAEGDGDGDGADVFVFESGTLVSWSLPEPATARLATELLGPAAVDPLDRARCETESLEYVRDGARDASAMRGDVVVLATPRSGPGGGRLPTTLAQIAFSSGLARSTKLAALESSLQAYFGATRRVPQLLARGLPLGRYARRAFLQRQTGELLSLRAQLNHYRELTDSLPDIFWDSRRELGLEDYYDQVGRALDVGVRIRTLNEKMGYAHEIATVLREISSEKHGARLEWIIIVLIAVEVVFELRRVFLEKKAEPVGPAGEAAAMVATR